MVLSHRWLITTLLITAISGCAPHPLDHSQSWTPPPTPLAADHPAYTPPIDPEYDPSPAIDPTGNLSLSQVIQLVLAQSPDLAGYAWEIRAAEARSLQASLRPNPQIAVEVENFAGSDDLGGFDAAETTISLSQVFPLGDKLKRRTDLADIDKDLANWDYQIHRTRILVDATQRFVDVLAAQRQIQLAEESHRLATLVHEAVTHRVQAGDAASTESSRTAVLLAVTKIDLQRTQRSLKTARIRLAQSWGATTDRFETATGSLDLAGPVPDFDTLNHWVKDNPQINRWAQQIVRQQATVKLAQANRSQDIEIEGGFRHFNDSDDTALVVGLSIPLPMNDNNQYGVLEARYNLAKANAQRQAAEVSMHAALAAVHQAVASSHDEATALRDDVIPTARAAFQAMQGVFSQGGGRYLDMLDAQKILTDLQSQYIKALARYHRNTAELEGLIARPLNTPNDPTTKTSKNNAPGDTQ